MERESRGEQLFKDYEDGLQYQRTTKLSENLPRYVDYYEGKQWGKIEAGTEQMPRCVLNITKEICDTKVANIKSIPCNLKFTNNKHKELAEKLTKYFKYWGKKERFEEKDDRALLDGSIAGTYVYHLYWDIEGSTNKVELIDPLNLIVANPLEEDIEQQKWIIIVSREDLEAVRDMADDGIDLESIISEKREDNPYNIVEPDGSQLCTVLTRYFKQDGKVYCEKGCSNIIINEAFPLTPNYETFDESEDIDVESSVLNPNGDKHEYAVLYPVTVGQFENRKDSINGIGIPEMLIPNQQATNIILSMQAQNVMMNGWTKYKVTPDALDGQEITNEVGQVLVDHSKSGKGIEPMPAGGFSSMPMQVLEQLVGQTKSVLGANQVLSGDNLRSGLSGAAIAMLQSQASLPIERLMFKHWRVLEQFGRRWLQNVKLYQIEEIKFSYDDNIDGEVKTYDETINVKELLGIEFDLEVTASAGTRSSTAGNIAILDNMLANKAITPVEYMTLYPDDAIGNKEEILAVLRENQDKEVTQLQEALANAQQQMAEASKVIADQSKVINDIVPTIRENNELKALVAQLQNEYATKINEANGAIGELTTDNEAMALALDNQAFNTQ